MTLSKHLTIEKNPEPEIEMQPHSLHLIYDKVIDKEHSKLLKLYMVCNGS